MPARPAARKASAPPDLATPEDVAEYLHKQVKTLANWRSTGYGPPWKKVGHNIFYDWAQVSAWLEKQSRGSSPRAVA